MAFVLYWLIRFRRQIFLSLIVLILTYLFFNPFFEISSEGDPSAFENTLSVLSYNVRLFNAYEENSTKDVASIISEVLADQNPDVVCIQEYYKKNNADFSSYPFQYIYYKMVKKKNGEIKESALGHAILSKYPLTNTGAFDFQKTFNNTIYADVIKGGDTIRVYNLHLKSLGIIPTVSSIQDGDKEKLRNRMTNAFIAQQEQVTQILVHKERSKYPVLLCGDFNNTPFSYVYRKLEKDMKDAYVERGNGIGTTYLFDSYPMRIDYVFTSDKLEVLKFETIKKTFSDHYPISAKIGWSPKPLTTKD